MDTEQEKMLTIYDVMKLLNVSRPKVFELMRKHGLPRVKMGARTLRFEKKALDVPMCKLMEEKERGR